MKAQSPPPPRRNRRSAEQKLAELKQHLLEISDLSGAGALLTWDQATYMPQGGAPARARQSAMLHRLAHERLIDRALGRLLDDLQPYAESLPADSDTARLIRVARRDFEKAIKVPAEHVARASALGSASYDAWTQARPENDFATMLPYLEQSLELSREYSGFFAPYQHVADPFIDDADEGMTAASVGELFGELKRALVPLAQAVIERPAVDDACLHGRFSETAQMEFSRRVAARIGYAFERGRLDLTHHPFCTKFSVGDVRITTRVFEDDLSRALFSTLHEAGHALYEQGIDASFGGTVLASGTSAGVHESQSRLWENVVGRSRGFWLHFFPQLRALFPDRLGNVPPDTFYCAINKVARSLIRADADEVTYNLHVMLRFDLELKLLEGTLRAQDLPEAFRAAMREEVGVAPPDDRDGCLQDVHWYSGLIGGGFQSYTIGNILSAQFYAAAVKGHPEIPREIEAGEFGTLHRWLKDNIYRHGRKFPPNALITRTVGAVRIEPYLGYLRSKYAEIYELD